MRTGDVEARTAIVGVGGAGCNVIEEFYWNLPEVDTIAIDNNLPSVHSDVKLSLQSFTTDFGNGFRGDGFRREVAELLRGYDVVYVIAGLGGRTGSPISPLVVDVAANSGCMITSIAVTSGTQTPSVKETVEIIRSRCPMTLVVDNSRVPKSIDPDMRFKAVNRSIVSYVEKHREKLVSAFVKNLSKNVRDACKVNGRIATPFFAGCVTN